MAKIKVDGLNIDYELLGPEGAQAVAITPGGRFSRFTPGVRELGMKLADKGRRVLLWDRPNCGSSDMRFDGPSESVLWASALIGLIRELDLGPTSLCGGSGGSRVSMIAAARDPSAVKSLAIWWVTGGPLMMVAMAAVNCSQPASTARLFGMEAVSKMPIWRDTFELNPKSRDVMLNMDPEQFIAVLERWVMGFLPAPHKAICGAAKEELAKLTMPVLIMRNGSRDLFHVGAATDELEQLLPHAKVIDAPWPDDEWNRRFSGAGTGGQGHYSSWPDYLPDLLDDFIKTAG